MATPKFDRDREMNRRKESAPKYNPDRASMILAEAEMFGDVQICQKWSITRQTLHNYRKRLESDSELLQLLTLKRRFLLMGWQEQACKTLNVALADLCRRIPIAATEEEGKIISYISQACKVVGELKIAGDALSDPDFDGVTS